jgi:hypothetical protein
MRFTPMEECLDIGLSDAGMAPRRFPGGQEPIANIARDGLARNADPLSNI